MNQCVCALSGRGSGAIQQGPLWHPCCVLCGAMRGRTFSTRAAAEKALSDHERKEHGR